MGNGGVVLRERRKRERGRETSLLSKLKKKKGTTGVAKYRENKTKMASNEAKMNFN